jgi:hypothetical protein
MSKSTATPLGSLPIDANGAEIQIAGQFVTADVTGTPITSPLSYTNATTTLVVPDSGIEFIVLPTTDLKVSNKSDMSSYDLVKANTKECFPVARMQNIYVTEASADGTAYFRFTTL